MVQTVDRLDYSKPPPGYLVHDLNDDGWWWRIDEPEDGCVSPYAAEPEAIASAWVHYKTHNDPPGLTEIFRCGGLADGQVFRGWKFRLLADGQVFRGWKFRFGIASDEVFRPDHQAARAAAWAWYDRRLTLLAEVVTHQFIADDFWPAAMTWSDEQVADVERWLVNHTAELPEVLGG